MPAMSTMVKTRATSSSTREKPRSLGRILAMDDPPVQSDRAQDGRTRLIQLIRELDLHLDVGQRPVGIGGIRHEGCPRRRDGEVGYIVGRIWVSKDRPPLAVEGLHTGATVREGDISQGRQVDLPTLRYVSLADGGSRVETFNSKGGPIIGNPDPADNITYFTVTTTRTAFVANSANTNGALSDIKVQVQFTDQLDQASAPVLRTVTLNRRIVHG